MSHLEFLSTNDVILQLFKDSDSFILTKGLQKIKKPEVIYFNLSRLFIVSTSQDSSFFGRHSLREMPIK